MVEARTDDPNGDKTVNTLGNRIDDLVMIQNTQPTSINNEIWVDSSETETIEIPSYEEYENLLNGIGEQYDEDNGTYEVGDYVLYESKLYKCKVDISAPEPWTPAHWEETFIVNEYNKLNDEVNKLKSAVGGGSVTLSFQPSALKNGYYMYNTNTGKIVYADNASYYTVEPMDISSLLVGSSVAMKSSLASNYGIFITDNSLNVLDYVNGNNAEEKGYTIKSSPVLVTMTIPENAKYITSDIHSTYYGDIADFDVSGFTPTRIDDLYNLIESRAIVDKTLTIDGMAADAKIVGDRITDLKNDINFATGYGQSVKQPIDDEPYDGYWSYNNQTEKVTLMPSTLYYTLENPIDISDYSIGSEVSTLSSLTSTYGVYIVDEAYNVLDYINGNNAESRGYSISSNLQLVSMNVPRNAKYIISHIRNQKYSGISDFNVSGYTKPYTEELEEMIETQNSEISEIKASKDLETYEITPSFTDGYYVFVHNELVDSSTYSITEYIDVKPFKSITVAWDFAGTGAAMVFLSEDRETVITAYRAADLGASPSTITVPNGAAWFRTTQRTSKKNTFSFIGTMNYIDSIYDLTSATEPKLEQPLDNIIHDGGFCRIFDKIGVVGDSLASGSIARPDSSSHEEDQEEIVDLIWYSWIQHIARYSGSTAYNFSMGGLSARGLRFGTGNVNVQEIIANLENSDKKCKMYFIALGHNDRNYANTHSEYTIGTASDCNLANPSENADSYYGNMAWTISKVKSVQPKAKIFLITMKSATTFGAYNVAIRNLVNIFNTYYGNNDVYLIDMEGVPIETSWEYYNGHGSPQGYLNYSYQISSYVDYIIRHNQNDFKTVPYIGTTYLT